MCVAICITIEDSLDTQSSLFGYNLLRSFSIAALLSLSLLLWCSYYYINNGKAMAIIYICTHIVH